MQRATVVEPEISDICHEQRLGRWQGSVNLGWLVHKRRPMRRVPRRILVLGVVAASLVVGDVVVHAGEADDLRDRAGQLESGLDTLEAREEASVLELFALDSELARATGRVDTLAAQAERVEDATNAAREQTQIARAALTTAEESLAERVRALYMAGEIDSLEVILGARSVQDAIDGIGALRRTVSRDDEILTQVSEARRNAIELRDDLRRRQSRVDDLVADAEAARQGLERSRAERRAFLQSLREELDLSRRDIRDLRARAITLEARAAEIQAQATAGSAPAPTADEGSTAAASPPEGSGSSPPAPPPSPSPPSPPPAPPSPPSPPPSVDPGGGGPRPGSQMTVLATAYSLTGTTAVGVQTQPGIIAVDPNVIPLGTKMSVPGYGDGVAADTGSGVKGAIIDVWLPTLAEARAWGRRTVTITFK